MERVRGWALVLVLAVLAGCGGQQEAAAHDLGTRFFYDGAGRLAAVQRGSVTAVYRFDAAGNRVAVSHIGSESFDPRSLRAPASPGPRGLRVTPHGVGQGATVHVSGSGFDPDPIGDVVAVGGDALGRVVRASRSELEVQLPPVATPGPVTVSTAWGRATSHDDLVVVPAGVDPAAVSAVVPTAVGRETEVRSSGLSLLTFSGEARATVQLHLASSSSIDCDSADVGLAGPTGAIIDDGSWCDRPARLPMTGTYTASVSAPGRVRATLREVDPPAPTRPSTPYVPVGPASSARTWGPPTSAGPPVYAVDLSSGLLNPSVTDLALGGSGAADLTRSFSVGDPDLPALPPEQPLARWWSVGGSIALEPSTSNSYLDVVMPDGRRLPMRRVTSGAPEPDGAVFEPSGGAGSGPFAGSEVTYTGSGWELRTRAGTVLGFGVSGSPKRLSWIRSEAGTARFVRSASHDLLAAVSEDGAWARFVRDSEGRISAATDQVGDTVSYRYVRPSRLSADVLSGVVHQRAGGPETTVGYRYQPLTGRLLAVTDGRRDRLRFGYDGSGRVTRAGPWRFRYALGRRVVRVPGRPGSMTLPQVRRVVVSGPDGRRVVRFREGVFAPAPRAVESSVAPGYVAGTFVDARGRVAARRTAGGVVRIGYDAFDRPVSITDPGGSTRFGYTSSGDLAWVSDGSGTTLYTWNATGQQTSETDPLGGRQLWRYDAAGRLVWSRDARGVASTFGYDRWGRLAVARYGVSRGRPLSSVRYGYGSHGRLVSVRDSSAGGATLRYDARGRLVGETTSSGTVASSFDDAGRRSAVALPGGVRTSYGYDSRGRPARLSLGVAQVQARYDSGGRLSALDLPHGVHGRFSYEHGRPVLLSYTRGGHVLAEQRASYDSAGRPSRLVGDLARSSLPAAQESVRFDDAHQVTGAGWRWDPAGNLLDDGTHQYTWDERGRLVGVNGAEGRTTYGYDPLGRRSTATTNGQTVRFVYDGDDVVQRVAADGTRTTYLRGPDGTPLASATNGRVTALLPDLFGNVGATIGPDGKVARYSYDPFGSGTGGPDGATPGFRGLLADSSGRLAMGSRTYDSSTGRFLSRDTWGIEGGDTDPYRYALGAPTVFTDPSGHAAECVGLALGWAMSVLGPGGGWDDYDALDDQQQAGQISQDEWTVRVDALSHHLWSSFDVVANVCGSSAVGSSAAALPLLGAGKVGGRVLGSLADDAVEGAAATRVGTGFGRESTGISETAGSDVERVLQSRTLQAPGGEHGLVPSRAVRFTQDSAGATFMDGRDVFDLANEMASTRRAPPGLAPIRIFSQDGELFSLDNRRLFAGQYADVDLPYRWASPSEIKSRHQTQIFGGASISIRLPGGRSNRGWWQP